MGVVKNVSVIKALTCTPTAPGRKSKAFPDPFKRAAHNGRLIFHKVRKRLRRQALLLSIFAGATLSLPAFAADARLASLRSAGAATRSVSSRCHRVPAAEKIYDGVLTGMPASAWWRNAVGCDYDDVKYFHATAVAPLVRPGPAMSRSRAAAACWPPRRRAGHLE